MRVLGWIVGALMLVLVVVFGLQVIASESGEVVVLHTDDGGRDATTRLWVVDHDGRQWLRASTGSGWLQRLQSAPRVELERDGQRAAYRAAPEPAMAERINTLMAQKYGWRDEVIAVLVGGREDAVAVSLNPIP